MNRLIPLGLLALLACEFNPGAKVPVAAAHTFTQKYAKQKLEASAAGNDCMVLLIRANIALDNATVESIHYGTSQYGAYDGGVQQFAQDMKFRAVVYRDTSEKLWTYGAITREDAASIHVCR